MVRVRMHLRTDGALKKKRVNAVKLISVVKITGGVGAAKYVHGVCFRFSVE